MHPCRPQACIRGLEFPFAQGVIAQILQGLVDLAVDGLEQLTPAAECCVEIERRAAGEGFQPAARQPGRWRGSQPLLLEQVVDDGLAVSLSGAIGLILREGLHYLGLNRTPLRADVDQFLHLPRQALSRGRQPQRPEMGLEQLLIRQLQRWGTDGTRHHPHRIGEEILIVG